MIFAILTCISLVVLGVGWFLYQRNIELFLCLLIAMYSEFFYLLPRISGPEDYKLLLLPMITILLFESLLTGKLALGRYGWWVLSFLAISVMGVFVAWFSGQSILLGIKAAKFIPLTMVYFLLAGRQIKIEKFSTYFILMGLAVASIALICFATHGAVNPFPGIEQDKLFVLFGKPRLTVGQFVISAAAVVAFARYKQNSSIIFLLASVALFGEVVFIQQTRGFIVAILLSMFIVYMLPSKLTPLRISFNLILTGGFFCSWLLLSGADFSSFSVVKRTKTDFAKRGGSYGGSAQARLNAYRYYWEQIQQHPIAGRGIYNFNWEGNTENRLQEYEGIHLSDIGIIPFIVQAGLVGIIWIVYGLLNIWKDIWVFRNNLVISSYFIIGTFTMPTLDMFLRKDSLFLFAVFLGLTSSIIVAVNSDAVPEGT